MRFIIPGNCSALFSSPAPLLPWLQPACDMTQERCSCSAAVIPILIAVALDREGNCNTSISFSTTTTSSQLINLASIFSVSYNTDHQCRHVHTGSITMNSSGAEIASKTGQQPRNIFCLNDQTNIACFMCFKRCVLHPNIQFFNL